MSLPEARLASINVGRAQRFEGDGDGKAFRSAILKGPVAGRVALGEEGVAGDVQADRRYHGGPDKAIYLYALEHLAFWQKALRCEPLPPGTLGENLTIEGWGDLEGTLHVGDTLAIGDGDAAAAIQLTTPRQPCWKLERRMGLPGFAKAFLESRRIGSYARVVKPGAIAAGDPIRVVVRSPRAATLRDLIDAWHFRDRDARARVLADDALHPALRRRFERTAKARVGDDEESGG
jgi:MOSC domain-containing protein YiiM